MKGNVSFKTVPSVINNILCTLFTYKDEGGSCDSSLWQTSTKVMLDLYIYNFHYKPLYISGYIYIYIMVK